MAPESEAAGRQERATAPDRAERLEMMFAAASQGFGACPAWFVTAFEDCERAGRTLPGEGGRAAEKKE